MLALPDPNKEIPVRANTLLHRNLAPCLASVHSKRMACVFDVVDALLRGGRLTATDLGRSLGGDVSHKHNIKRVDRLLGNWQLHAEMPVFCAAVGQLLLQGKSQPLILVDWTDIGPEQVALVAAVPIGGRALPIYFETHPLSRLSNPKVERNFLRALKTKIVPAQCSPIIITDAGFKNPWFQVVEKLGWDFVGRLSAHVIVSGLPNVEGQEARTTDATKVRELFADATATPEDLGEHVIAVSNPVVARIVRYKKLPKGRKGSKKVNRKGIHPGSMSYKKYQQRAKNPWVLITSLRDGPACQISNLYSRRMEIEELFRDEKSHRFGWSFEDAASKYVEHLRALLLIACLALLAQTLIGIVAEQCGLHRQYQANTVRDRRVLSFFVLGRLLIADQGVDQLLTRLKPDPFEPLRARVAIHRGSER